MQCNVLWHVILCVLCIVSNKIQLTQPPCHLIGIVAKIDFSLMRLAPKTCNLFKICPYLWNLTMPQCLSLTNARKMQWISYLKRKILQSRFFLKFQLWKNWKYDAQSHCTCLSCSKMTRLVLKIKKDMMHMYVICILWDLECKYWRLIYGPELSETCYNATK